MVSRGICVSAVIRRLGSYQHVWKRPRDGWRLPAHTLTGLSCPHLTCHPLVQQWKVTCVFLYQSYHPGKRERCFRWCLTYRWGLLCKIVVKLCKSTHQLHKICPCFCCQRPHCAPWMLALALTLTMSLIKISCFFFTCSLCFFVLRLFSPNPEPR